MAGQEKVLEKKRGRPAIGKGIQLNTMARPELVVALDHAIAAEPDTPSRSEFIRRLLADHLRAKGYLPKGEA